MVLARLRLFYPAYSGITTRDYYPETNDLFYLELRYDQLFANNTAGGDIGSMSGTAQKAGNISQMAWRVRGRDRQAYSFTYDHLSRMTAATYYDVNSSNTATNTSRFNESLTYDLRGNISSLQRQGYYSNSCNYGQIDNLSYTYATNTNRIATITESAPATQKSHGFNPGSGGAGYGYDTNGNLKSDTYKGISNISYNHLNLPSVITFSSGNSIEFIYDAGGMKLRKTVKVGTTVQYEQDYLGGLEYRKNGTGSKRIEAVYHNEGRYLNLNAEVNNTLLWQKEYTLKDHLGNARVTFTDKNANGIVDIPTDIVQENHYYPFGLNYEGSWRMNDAVAKDTRYQFNSIEWQDDFGLNLDIALFRTYDPAIGRWWQIDPKPNEKISVYTGFENNPILYSDMLGDTVDIQVSPGLPNDSGGNAIVSDDGEVVAGNEFRSITYTPGMAVTGEGGFVDQVITALNYIYENISPDAINELVSSSKKTTIVAYKRTEKGGIVNYQYFEDNSDGKGGSYLMFNPNMGMVFYPATDRPNTFQYWFGDWGYRSPIEALHHELEHNRSFFENPVKHYNDSMTADPHYRNLEEKQAVRVENQAARKLFGDKAKLRKHHGGMYRKAKNGLYPYNN